MAYLMRVVLPDRPGSLGALATAIGLAGGDIVSVDIVDKDDAYAVDDIVVDLGPGQMPDQIMSAAQRLEGVHIESIRPFDGGLATYRELGLIEAMTADPDGAPQLMLDEIPLIFRSGWALIVNAAGALTLRSATAPDTSADPDHWRPPDSPRLINPIVEPVPDDWARLDTSLMAVPAGPSSTIIVGRPGGPDFRPSELARLTHLVGIAGTINMWITRE